jgi:hypothetical protein
MGMPRKKLNLFEGTLSVRFSNGLGACSAKDWLLDENSEQTDVFHFSPRC